MKKVMLLLVTAIFICSCASLSGQAKSVKPELGPNVVEEWKVIEVACPHLIIEKDGVKKILKNVLCPGTCINPMGGPSPWLGHCKYVKSGWILVVDAHGRKTLFLPEVEKNRSKKVE